MRSWVRDIVYTSYKYELSKLTHKYDKNGVGLQELMNMSNVIVKYVSDNRNLLVNLIEFLEIKNKFLKAEYKVNYYRILMPLFILFIITGLVFNNPSIINAVGILLISLITVLNVVSINFIPFVSYKYDLFRKIKVNDYDINSLKKLIKHYGENKQLNITNIKDFLFSEEVKLLKINIKEHLKITDELLDDAIRYAFYKDKVDK